MAHLEKANIEFIDKYLKNSGVEFVDIRLEMLDHVATALEVKMKKEKLSFYDAFKAYMLLHKKELLNSATSYRWRVDKKVLKKLAQNLLHPYIFAAMALIAILQFVLDVPLLERAYVIPSVVFLSIFFLVPYVINRKFKISFLNRLFWVAWLFNYFIVNQIYLSEFIRNSDYTILVYTSIIWINLSLVKTSFDLSKYYRTQYLPA